MKKLIRTVQTRFPFLLELKTTGQRLLRQVLKRPSEATYTIFRTFPFAEGTVFIDAGANRGQTIASFRLYNKTTRIEAFEPNPKLAERLRKRFSGDRNTTINAFGLADEPGSFRLYVPFYRKFEFDGLASFDERSAREWLSPRFIYNFDPSLVTVEALDCHAKSLDEMDLAPALVKIDVQGFETKVLEGGRRTIDRHRPVFIIENNDDGMGHAAHLAALDYVMTGFADDEFDVGRIGDVNSVFVPREKLDDLVAHFRRAAA